MSGDVERVAEAKCPECGHLVLNWHHDERGCVWHGVGPSACPCGLSTAQALLAPGGVVAGMVAEAVEAAVKRHVVQLIREKHQAREQGAAEVRARVAAALDERVSMSLATADWASDTASGGYALVNPDWLRAIVAEARDLRAALAAETAENGQKAAQDGLWGTAGSAGRFGALEGAESDEGERGV
jgi:hypothetical protein